MLHEETKAMVDGIAIGPEGEQIAIEVKSPRDDVVRGIGQWLRGIVELSSSPR